MVVVCTKVVEGHCGRTIWFNNCVVRKVGNGENMSFFFFGGGEGACGWEGNAPLCNSFPQIFLFLFRRKRR